MVPRDTCKWDPLGTSRGSVLWVGTKTPKLPMGKSDDMMKGSKGGDGAAGGRLCRGRPPWNSRWAPRRRQEEAVLRTVGENKWDSGLDADK